MAKFAGAPLAVAILAGSLAAGCAGGMTLGKAIQGESADLAEIGATWTKGDELASEGRADIEDGREMIAKGRELVADGEDKVAAGQTQREDAERAYRKRTGRPLPDL
jgi:hypothetical protein